ncbi:MAG: hypothetical protein IID36_11345 [Planctomycetes bacterium]|nr:hypothetical protein [Planctomycetota bacterium]
MSRFFAGSVLLCACMVELSWVSSARATEVEGEQSGVWSAEHNPYLMTGDVVVPPGGILAITPGVVVRALGHYRIIVQEATLLAVGSPNAPITMTADDVLTGWRGILLQGATDDSTVSHTIITYSKGTGDAMEVGGGAIKIRDCAPTISYNVFRFNSSHNQNFNGTGGAVCARLSSASIVNNMMFQNSADSGGAIYAGDWGSPLISGNIVVGNSAELKGGGINIGARSTALVEHNIVIGNRCDSSVNGGGGITSWTGFGLFGTFAVYRNNLVAFNTAATAGGGMYLRYDRGIITNNLIAFNFAPSGGGIHAINFPSSAPILSNNVIWGNTATIEGPQIDLNENTGSEIDVTYSIVQGGWPGVGNIDADPMFIAIPNPGPDGQWGTDDDDLGNLRVLPDSPAIGAGDPFLTDDPGETDLDGHARVLCDFIDMGPYEFGIGDYNCDQTVDLDDYAFFTQCLTGPNGGPLEPGCAPFDFNADGAIDLRDAAGFQRAFMEFTP